MKHNIKVTIILLAMFIIAQLIGIYATSFYLSDGVKLPYGFDNNIPSEAEKTTSFYSQFLTSLIVSFVIAILLVFFLMRIKFLWFIRAWFFVVIALALGIMINIPAVKLGLPHASFIALAVGIFLAYFKIFQRNVITHNLTELLIYPGIAVLFVGFLNIYTTITLLVLISIYDMWAVWRSKFMIKMAKFQMNDVGIFGGFLVPYAPKAIREKIKLLRLKYRNKEIPTSVIKRKNIKVGLAILGGGDVVFPIIASGVFFKTYHSLPGTLMITLGASLALVYLFVFGKKKKYYPAMPYLTAGIFLGMVVGRLLVG